MPKILIPVRRDDADDKRKKEFLERLRKRQAVELNTLDVLNEVTDDQVAIKLIFEGSQTRVINDDDLDDDTGSDSD
jgi:hypothetical protein